MGAVPTLASDQEPSRDLRRKSVVVGNRAAARLSSRGHQDSVASGVHGLSVGDMEHAHTICTKRRLARIPRTPRNRALEDREPTEPSSPSRSRPQEFVQPTLDGLVRRKTSAKRWSPRSLLRLWRKDLPLRSCGSGGRCGGGRRPAGGRAADPSAANCEGMLESRGPLERSTRA
jgi:hypothetical protein